MPRKIYARVGKPGFARVSNLPGNSGVRMPIIALIKGLAMRGRHRWVTGQ